MIPIPSSSDISINFPKKRWAETVLSVLPFTLFFPSAVYIGFVLFLVALVIDGDYIARWHNIKSNPIFKPALILSVVYSLVALYSERGEKFWTGFAHYQTYLILLLFVSVGRGKWQERAAKSFIAGALLAASIFYLTKWDLIPSVSTFKNYVLYSGNKSILIGILLAVAGGLVLFNLCSTRSNFRYRLVQFAIFLYICGALFFVAMSRSGYLIFFALTFVVMLRMFFSSPRNGVILFLSFLLLGGITWKTSELLQRRVIETISEATAYMQNSNVKAMYSTGIRLQMIRHTLEMIKEKPLFGLGIGSWKPIFLERYQHTIRESSTTPHNDYLLYAAEGGVIGLGALLLVWLTQLRIALHLRGYKGMWLALFTTTLIVGGMFNAILRDLVFAMPMMVLLAIPLAGAQLKKCEGSSERRWKETGVTAG